MVGHRTKVDYNDVTTITIPNKVRKKLGDVINHNETIPSGLERILDKEKSRLGQAPY